MSKKLIDLHKEWCEKGELDGESGLCSAIPQKYHLLFELVRPTKEENEIHTKEGYNWMWWGELKGDYEWGGYNYLRQTIVLLICAMNNEI